MEEPKVMELEVKTQITDHSSEHIESEVMEQSDHPEDDLTAILKAKDEQIKRLQLGNLCFSQRAKYLEGKVEELKNALEEASYRFSGINQVLGIVSPGVLSSKEIEGVLLVVRHLGDEGESEVNHNLAMSELPDAVNRSTDSEG
jgi:hypothetical protein